MRKMAKKPSKKQRSATLSALRAEIDAIDKGILKSVNKRASLAVGIMDVKKEMSKGVYDPEREKEIEKKIVRLNKGPLDDFAALSIFREIIHSCRNLQSRGRVSYLGPEGSFSHQAASKVFRVPNELIVCKTLEDVFDRVLAGSVSKGFVPIENSTEGSVARVLEIIAESEVRIVGEYFENISHFLVSKTANLRSIRNVASHPQALGQCRKWLLTNLPGAKLVETPSTAAAAAIAATDGYTAAVSSTYSASIYKLRVVAENIEDNPLNATRFVTVEKSSASREMGEGNKVSIIFSTKDEPGALQKTLFSPLASAGVNLTRIESRPSGKRPWEYIFFVDFEGSPGQRKTDALLEKIESKSSSFKTLGCYFSGKKTQTSP